MTRENSVDIIIHCIASYCVDNVNQFIGSHLHSVMYPNHEFFALLTILIILTMVQFMIQTGNQSYWIRGEFG